MIALTSVPRTRRHGLLDPRRAVAQAQSAIGSRSFTDLAPTLCLSA